jgi:spermidine synthase
MLQKQVYFCVFKRDFYYKFKGLINKYCDKDKKWDVIIIDINSSDVTSDFWAPTKDFVEIEFLKNCHTILTKSRGLMVMNMICNDLKVRDATLRDLHSIWPNMLVNKLEKNRNEIIFAFDQPRDKLFQKNPFQDKNNNNDKAKSGNALLLLEEVSNHIKEIKF